MEPSDAASASDAWVAGTTAMTVSPKRGSSGLSSLDGSLALNHYLSSFAAGRREIAIDGFGKIPDMADALRQVDIVAAIIESSRRKRPEKVKYTSSK